jgi:hypothetical protein
VDKENDLAVQFTVNGKEYGDAATKFPFRVQWDTAKLENGKYEVSGVMRDKAGNTSKLNSVTVTVGN